MASLVDYDSNDSDSDDERPEESVAFYVPQVEQLDDNDEAEGAVIDEDPDEVLRREAAEAAAGAASTDAEGGDGVRIDDDPDELLRREAAAIRARPPAAAAPFAVGETVVYVPASGAAPVDARVVKVHYDDAPPYYTIRTLADGRERQTVA